MKKMIGLFVLLIFMGLQVVTAQSKQISGTITSAEDGLGMPGVSVVLKGTTIGASTDIDGRYSLEAKSTDVLLISFVGMVTQEIKVGDKTVINVVMETESIGVDEVVVTALGITKEKKSLGYAVQEVGGDNVSTAKDNSFISSLSGRVSGLSVKKSGQIGGSVNAIIRGSNSFTGNNQALFVVDGVPISNSNTNTSDAQRNRGGYDYGNAASDIDPESIESISVLKGATASALYGSDAANGVILITTKRGKAKKGIGVTINQSMTISSYDKETFPEFQSEYGAGYGPYYGSTGAFDDEDVNGDGVLDYAVPYYEDASFGGAFDGTMVYQWDALYPQLDTYGQKSAWSAPKNGPDHIFKNGMSNVTSISIDGGNEKGTFRLGYTNDDRSGILDNSKVKKDIIDVSTSYKLTDKLSFDAKTTFTRTSGKGRYGTGYDPGNVVQMLRQWYQTNVDLEDQKQAYLSTRENITWNPSYYDDVSPKFWDNPYFVLNENYETDSRTRFFGKFQAGYEFNDNISLVARFGVDTYTDLREERTAMGSLDVSEYEKYERRFQEYNSDFILNFNKKFSDDFSLTGLAGMSIKTKYITSTRTSTNGGLVVAGVYALSNSTSTLEPSEETDIHTLKYGYYSQLSLAYANYLYLEGTVRVDQSSTLPSDNNTYVYPSVSTSFVFSELLDISWLNFGKFRAGYAEVANDASSYSVKNTFSAATSFGSTPIYNISNTSNNPDLKAESTAEVEFGLEMKLLNNRLGFDLSFYEKRTTDQILPVTVSPSTGYNFKYVNAGEMRNQGVEVSMFGSPVKTRDFEWNINLNWAKNKNEVISLFGDTKNLLIYTAWNTAINARVDEAYGSITGYDFLYKNGKKVIGSDGKYVADETNSSAVIGNIQPDWNAGISNNFRYKDFTLGFLIDISKGGDVVSYDMAFGNATGLYKETAGLNELGNPKRNSLADGGGILLDGVDADGNVNTTRAYAGTYEHPFGYYGGSDDSNNIAIDNNFLYDASYVKLRELTIGYKLPKSIVSKTFFTDISFGLFGRNLWIISKNMPYGDPEYAASSGNYQGIQNGSLPTTKEYGFNLKITL
ncbi:MAG: SusC/RagA family TonB-linked outer membrane protein [Labilibaculum antarcticum]